MYTRGAFGNWGGRGRGRGRGQDESLGQGQSLGRGRGQDTGAGQGWGKGRGTSQSAHGAFDAPIGRGRVDDSQCEARNSVRGRGDERYGGFHTSQSETSSWNNNQSNRGRGGLAVSQGSSGSWSRGRGGRGRGRGGGGGGNDLTDQEQTEILSSRKSTVYISSEGTDDLIVPSTIGVEIGLASQVLQQSGLEALQTPLQMKLFIQSCLLNLSNHHSVDTSEVFFHLTSEKGLSKLRHIMLQPVSIGGADDASSSTMFFLSVVLPLIGLLTRQSICQTVLRSESNLIYRLVKELREQFLESVILSNIRSLLNQRPAYISSRGFPALSSHPLQEDRHVQDILHSSDFFLCALLSIVRLFYQVLTRFPGSASELVPLIDDLVTLVGQCLQLLEGGHAQQVHLNSTLGMEMRRLSSIIHDMISNQEQSLPQPWLTLSSPSGIPFDGPGKLALQGPRHDNDHAMIAKIDLVPTRDEILCRDEPYLPINNNKDQTTHFLPSGWSRHFDDHFRLIRHDIMEPFCSAIQAFVDILEKTNGRGNQDIFEINELTRLLDDNINMNVYSNVQFLGISTDEQYPGSTKISFDQPNKVQGLDQEDRENFWELARGRLIFSGIVGFVKRSGGQVGGDFHGPQVLLAMVRERDIHELSKSESTAFAQVFFTESASYSTVLTPPQSSVHNEGWFMVECPGSLFEAYRVVLKALQRKLPSTMPFRKYIAPSDEDTAEAHHFPNRGPIDPPLYTTTPGFKFDISVLLENERSCELDVRDALSVDQSITTLKEHSSLDDTQVAALVETLSKEFALISGLPASGKTKIGVDLVKVLLHNKQAMNCGPILVMSYTNHALDQFLGLLLDHGYNKIARLGLNSRSRRLAQYNLHTMLESRSKEKPFAAKRYQGKSWLMSKRAVEAIRELSLALESGYFNWRLVKEHLEFASPAQCRQFESYSRMSEGWRGDENDEPLHHYLAGKDAYERWATGKDLEETRGLGRHDDGQDRPGVQRTNAILSLGQDHGENVGMHRGEASVSGRPLSLLGGDVWSMTMAERRRLIEHWSPDIRQLIEMELEQHHQYLKSADENKYSAHDEHSRLILSSMDVIGMTTTGSAQNHVLLESVAPKIILCVEAGEVLESHILSALSPSTQQLILIGDHLQLRPYVQNINLSSESSIGQKYNLDTSLFERLVTSKVSPLPVSRLTTQHRMRSEISSLVRNALYPALEDDGFASQHPDIAGMATNLFFMNHCHPEDTRGLYDSQFFSNKFEIEMIEALTVHLTRNGYSKPGDIVILTPYLGQLNKIFYRLQSRFRTQLIGRDSERMDSSVGEQDAEAMQRGQSQTLVTEKDNVAINHIAFKTIDNFQGEEAKIAIISLVRSNASSGDEDVAGSEGFLKFPNLTNVLLTRAQHGMFIIGNAEVMAQPKHGVWPAVMKDLQHSDRAGPGFPISCKKHPDMRRIVCNPEDLHAAAPDGGCHPDNPEHHLVKCREPCLLPQSGCRHLCQKMCWEDCRDCSVVVPPWNLPCGHEVESPRCWQLMDPTKIRCTAKVDVDNDPILVPPCGHPLTVSTLDGLIHLGDYYQKQSDESSGVETYIAIKDLNTGPRQQVDCSVCSEPIGASFFRYGRPIKHSQLLSLMQEFRKTHFKKLTIDDRNRCMEIVESLVSAKEDLVTALGNTKVVRCRDPPQSNGRRVKIQDGVLVGDLGDLASLYQIPWKHQTAWIAAVTPVKDMLELLGQSLIERTPLKEVSTLLAIQSHSLGASVPWRRSFLSSQNTRELSSSPTKEEMAPSIRILGLESMLGPDGQLIYQRQLGDCGLVSFLLKNVYSLANAVMKEVGAESGWFWFVGDLLECCNVFHLRFKTIAHQHAQTYGTNVDKVPTVEKLVLAGFRTKLVWLSARPLGGKRTNEEFQKAVREIEGAFLAELSEQRGGGSGFGVQYGVERAQIEKEMEVLVKRVKVLGEKAQKLGLEEVKEW
ncbi:hypothetical protein BGZ95_000288 [Linnemannia exigua]|uniref:NFX1-type zinc finger-containing protein 1 n=1 Tax=Linnemannia exigua TaxID=604196 RepID=A0AAD4DJG6_9FUNG|nr:hypothetical protein BGZ95_000288 [Linnemannia exigua]